ncbi:hypothetical protein LEP1GSC115_4882 [Leptospira interrogans serovar Australis str. 200703203]|uniref:Uncharacterized protein n=1 Tax=Leptospira interrogans serovar Australis str. 200703203 TaxID=1085541 RepID=N1UKT4_LEPIR|nr:hypothetical protein LEP1GSC115_4882 [Leptospira interrogans serovar Australis str. 200703203]
MAFFSSCFQLLVTSFSSPYPGQQDSGTSARLFVFSLGNGESSKEVVSLPLSSLKKSFSQISVQKF